MIDDMLSFAMQRCRYIPPEVAGVVVVVGTGVVEVGTGVVVVVCSVVIVSTV
jgi:hypothetical protein